MANRPIADVMADLREAMRPSACRALESFADVMRGRPPRWPLAYGGVVQRPRTLLITHVAGTTTLTVSEEQWAALWRLEDEQSAYLRCPDHVSTHILDGDPAVEHARAHGVIGDLMPCPSCPGPALVRPAGWEADHV